MEETFARFFGDDPHLIAALEEAHTRVSYAKGALVFGEGDEGDTVYYILSGRAQAMRYSAGGTEVVVSSFWPGDLVGEMAALTGLSRSADLYAVEPLLMASFPGDVFLSLMEAHGAIGLAVSRLLAGRIQSTTHRLFEHATLSSKGRLCAHLLRLAGPKPASQELVIERMPTISAIARELSIARETVSRGVSELKEESALEAQGADLVIRNPAALLARLNQQ